MKAFVSWLKKHWGKCLFTLLFIAILAGFSTPAILISARFRSNTPFKLAHERAVNTFVDSKGFGIRRMAHDPPKEYWAEVSFILEDSKFNVNEVHLIGATKENGLRFFDTYYPPKKEQLSSTISRPLNPVEALAIETLRNRTKDYVVNRAEIEEGSNWFKSQVIAPIFAQECCLKCHDVEVGDLLGAFSYETTEQSKLPPSSNP